MTFALTLGFPRIGAKRELKKALESYWKGEISRDALLDTGRNIRRQNWALQAAAGIPHVPVGDFSFYDQVLDMACLLGVVPQRYGYRGGAVDLDTYFAMARGNASAPAMEMTKWFDTNYHYIVPEITRGQGFTLSGTKLFDEVKEAMDLGHAPLPVIIGPITFLRAAKKVEGFEECRCTLVPGLAQAYIAILQRLQAMGCTWVQMDEPCLVTDLPQRYRDAMLSAYGMIAAAVPGMNIFLTTYFGDLRDNLRTAFSLPIAAVHVDLCRAPGQLDACIAMARETGKHLTLGLVDGRNVWRNNLSASLSMLERAVASLGAGMVSVSGSCSLLHCPIDLDMEDALDPEVKGWMAFAKQKLGEIVLLAKGSAEGRDAIVAELAASDAAQAARRASSRVHNTAVRARVAAITPDMARRHSPFAQRIAAQRRNLDLPAFPTTTIGSFPQTAAIREARASFKRGDSTQAAYEAAMREEIARVVEYQHSVGLDVLVHGEPERNDMVEYFGEQLDGFVFSKHGWVQSYGSRYVKPPIIFGDVARPAPMTVQWAQYAQSLTPKVMKGMLTGPITILQWSFVRDDQERAATARQIALAIRDEVADLEQAGIKIIQIDEAAIREGLPLRRADWQSYLDWAVECFRLTACCVTDTTQIHTHMCYSEFNDIIESIGAMDADVISIETSRSQMELLDAFAVYKYPNEIGPGVYDIHSPRIPTRQEMIALMEKAAKVIDPAQLWVNPDCGLKTRGWAEVEPALKNMVEAAQELRRRIKISRAA